MGLTSRLRASQSFLEARWKVPRMRCTMQVWTMAAGQALPTTSGSPLRPSQTTKNTSLIPRLRRSVSTLIQNLAPSPPDPAHRPRTSFSPARGDPDGRVDAPVGALPVADLDRDRVDDPRRVALIQRPVLPAGHLLDD